MKLIDLGCGKSKVPGSIGVDIANVSGVDIVHDCEKGLPFEDNYADEVYSNDFIEHIRTEKVIHVMNEIWRVLKPGGKFIFKIPDAERGQGWAQDPTHKSFWVKNSFKYYENNYYHDLYGIKAKFKIGKLESIRYEDPYWGENFALAGFLIANKGNNVGIRPPTVIINEPVKRTFITDDLCPSNLKHFAYWDKVKSKFPDLKLIAFAIARNNDKLEEDVAVSQEFKEWYEKHKDWVEIGVHGYDHQRPQEGWREDQEKYIRQALDTLRVYLPARFLYRAPGFRTLPKTEAILKKLGFAGIAHQSLIKYFDGTVISNLVNTHCSDQFDNPIASIWDKISYP